jgi:single-strand DNA-binding protein
MANFHEVGRLSADPILKFTQAGKAICSFSIVYDHRANAAGEKQSTFIDVVAWGELGEHVATSVGKGDRVAVSGDLHQRNWETDGQKRSKLELWADAVSPDLRFATATISRVDSNTGPAKKPAPARRPQPQYEDEEAF